ncbi:MAG TPA: hypothetical protein VN039_12160, partial [Nitrospira sp.]|nr:hypothetical protein [Nitrospira sp.]
MPVVGSPSDHPHGHAVVVFDAETGQRIGHNPNYVVEQSRLKKVDGGFSMTLKLRHIKDS